MNQYLASHRYVVLSVNYRSGMGYGLNFREALNHFRVARAARQNSLLPALRQLAAGVSRVGRFFDRHLKGRETEASSGDSSTVNRLLANW